MKFYNATPIQRGPGDWENVFVITGVRYIGAVFSFLFLFLFFFSYFFLFISLFFFFMAEKYRSLYRGRKPCVVFSSISNAKKSHL